MNTLNIILQSSAAGVSFSLGVVACLFGVSVYTARARKKDLSQIASENSKIAERCLRSAIANELSAKALIRIAEQFEKTANNLKQ
jgi:hypothetical protein